MFSHETINVLLFIKVITTHKKNLKQFFPKQKLQNYSEA